MKDEFEDPQPGDFDDELKELPEASMTRSPGHPDARLLLQVTIAGAEADKLRRLAEVRGQRPSDVVADLLRSA